MKTKQTIVSLEYAKYRKEIQENSELQGLV